MTERSVGKGRTCLLASFFSFFSFFSSLCVFVYVLWNEENGGLKPTALRCADGDDRYAHEYVYISNID